ncbi:MFS transporter [Rugosimonospora acidiphila]|uniref:MFS transporter n=1 Tax=Rugosimonospora acidiphila TaxID=556531 RepID=A0ABP9RMG2_9ACTN
MTTTTVRPAGRPTRAPAPPVRSGVVLFAALLGFFMIGLDASAVNVALPRIGEALGGSTTGLQWIVDAYTLMFAALLLSAGALSDRLGANRVFAAGIAVFTVASAACGLAGNTGVLIGARLLQGSAAAVVLPSSLALVRWAFPDAAERGRAIAMWTVGGAVSTAAGPVVGGALTSSLGWRTIFFLNLPVGLLTLAMLTKVPGAPRRAAQLDPLGQLLAVLALGGLIYGVIQAGASGFSTPSTLIGLLVAAVAGAAFLVTEARVGDPMVPLSLLRSRTTAICLTVGFAVNAAFYGVIFALSLFFQQVLGQSAIAAGVMFLPMTALVALANMSSARAAVRFGYRMPIAAGQLVCALGLLALLGVGIGAGTSRPLLAVLLIPTGIGLGFAVPSLTAAMLSDLPAERAGLAGGIFNAGRQMGGALAVAVFGALVSHPGSFVPGLRLSLLSAAVLLLVTFVATVFLPGRNSRR